MVDCAKPSRRELVAHCDLGSIEIAKMLGLHWGGHEFPI
jgi:hypothetical protein